MAGEVLEVHLALERERRTAEELRAALVVRERATELLVHAALRALAAAARRFESRGGPVEIEAGRLYELARREIS